ncbi:ScbA/BarX family gamma-butyrolactone biosynthesis protein [Micromonospora sp. CPCC 206060]|uniref:ScbA/BarX family gamma-butyrolactone biosynthesis protein n=1 Tax=Micromonospora sp. CPCC 206060 TaxID=3122406 RepID=UPI002FF0C046
MLYGRRDGRLDPMLVAETIRQAGILVAHAGYGVSDGHHFVMRRLAWRCAPGALRAPDGPVECVCVVRVSEVVRRADTVGGLRVDVQFCRDGEHFAAGSGWVSCLSPRVYQRIRARSRSSFPDQGGPPGDVPPALPASVGRDSVRDIVVGPRDETGTRALRVPLDHPGFFDHPVDHVPGMVLFEAMRQFAVSTHGPAARLVAAEACFPLFVELDRPCRIEPERAAAGHPAGFMRRVGLSLVQDGRVAVRGSVTVTCRP